jgi:hypothetical protein
MYLLNHNNVDNYPSAWANWKQKPSKEELVKVLSAYYDDEKSNKIANELFDFGSCSVDDSSCTEFELQNMP